MGTRVSIVVASPNFTNRYSGYVLRYTGLFSTKVSQRILFYNAMNQQYTKSPFLSASLVTTRLISAHVCPDKRVKFYQSEVKMPSVA